LTASIDLLRQTPLFRELHNDALSDGLAVARSRRISAGALLFHQEDILDRLWVMVRGRVQLYQLTPEGHQVILHIAGPGEEVGLMPALTGTPATVSARAMEDSELLVWDAETFRELMQRHPTLSFNAIAILGEHIRLYQARIRELTTERVERRLARTLLRLAQQLGKRTPEGVLIDLPLSRQNLAEMSGTTLYTASRILRAWEEAGIVHSGRERVVIRSPHKLVGIAEDLQPNRVDRR